MVEINPIPLDICWDIVHDPKRSDEVAEALLSILYWKEQIKQKNIQINPEVSK